jgi:NAD(P)-dependent dehydrogenase (short-subunit alcohol dehydrogenase family)
MAERKDTVLITGAAGFIGRALTQTLAGNYEVVGLDLSAPKSMPANAIFTHVDLSSDDSVREALGGVLLMMKTLAQEVAGRRIRVNGIAPGAIRTNINRASWEQPENIAELLRLIPYGRIGEPADVAEAAL